MRKRLTPGTGAGLSPRAWAASVCAGLAAALLAALLAACATAPPSLLERDATLRELVQTAPAYPDARFAVMSDPHLYDLSLGTEGEAFQAYLRKDRKLLRESPELLAEAVRILGASDAEFVVVPGDLTKDGEKSAHLQVAAALRALEAAGKPVYVTCGNHDILNAEAFRYDGAQTSRVHSVSPEEFAAIYAEFGFEEALRRDPASLSYVVEPKPGLWLLSLDSCRYRDNPAEGHHEAAGALSPATWVWIEETLAAAARQGKAVLAFLHHGITEHFPSQEKYYGEYVIDDGAAVCRLLAAYNVRVVFTGHFHAQDITVQRWPDGRYVYDVETGSLITYPCPLRLVVISGNHMRLKTRYVEAIPSRPQGLRGYARENTEAGIVDIAVDTMLGLNVPEEDARFIAPQIARAVVAHYAGDEQPPARLLDKGGVGFMGRLVLWSRRRLVEGLWQDLEPPDDDIVLDLSGGGWQR